MCPLHRINNCRVQICFMSRFEIFLEIAKWNPFTFFNIIINSANNFIILQSSNVLTYICYCIWCVFASKKFGIFEHWYFYLVSLTIHWVTDYLWKCILMNIHTFLIHLIYIFTNNLLLSGRSSLHDTLDLRLLPIKQSIILDCFLLCLSLHPSLVVFSLLF